MIEKERHIKEMYDMKHFHDTDNNKGYDYETNLFKRLMSSVMFQNEMMKSFLTRFQKSSVWMIQSVLVVRNFFDYSVDKYEDKHPN